MIRVENVQPYVSEAENSTNAYRMPNDDILRTMKEIDETGEDIIAVYHSHPTSEPIPSSTDTEVPDIEPAYLIVSLRDGQPRARAWRFDVEFIGSRRVTEVLLYVSEHGNAYADEQVSTVPWILTIGNRVEITYTRPHSSLRRTIDTVISGHGVSEDNVSVLLKSEDSMAPQSILLSRIQAIRLIRESAEAGRTRVRLQTLARWAAAQMSEGKFSGVGKVLEVLASAYPVNLTHLDTKED